MDALADLPLEEPDHVPLVLLLSVGEFRQLPNLFYYGLVGGLVLSEHFILETLHIRLDLLRLRIPVSQGFFIIPELVI